MTRIPITYFIETARSLVDEIIIRSNLTVFFEEVGENLPEFLKRNKVRLVCSLPCYLEKNVDSQRGSGVFGKSIRALKLLNAHGFGKDSRYLLDLVYNPTGLNLPPRQKDLELQYKKRLLEDYGICFSRLITRPLRNNIPNP